jgi:hypothetical protein
MRQLPKRLTAQSNQASWLNQLRECVEQRSPQHSTTVRISEGLKGFQCHAEPGESVAGGTGESKRVRILNIFDAVFEVRDVKSDNSLTGDIYFVAKPTSFRRPFPTSDWPGEQTRPFIYPVTGPNHATTPHPVAETETIYPLYLKGASAGSIIVIAKLLDRTDVLTPPLFPEFGPFLEWIDVNVDGRNWRVDFTAREFEVCVKREDGTRRKEYVQLIGGETYMDGA